MLLGRAVGGQRVYKHYGNGTIRETLEAINEHKIVLPAIQREFVWEPEQVCRLFDSLMQGYPFGTFLFWEVAPENSNQFKWYDFVREYHEKKHPHCPDLPLFYEKPLIAVLDGQQRLTALNIGLQGSMAWRLPRTHWKFDDNFPKRHLYCNLLANSDEDEGSKYQFDFLRSDRELPSSERSCWFRVADMMGMRSSSALHRWLTEKNLPEDQFDRALETLITLHEVVHLRPLVFCYGEQTQDIETVLQIFIRMNSGGTFLSYSDLLFSVAVAQWRSMDVREEIHGFVDELNATGSGFNFSKDFVLKAALMLSDMNVAFRASNFNRQNVGVMEENWGRIKQALSLAVELMDRFGFHKDNLRANNAILSIAYYAYNRGFDAGFLTHSDYAGERRAIRQWLICTFLRRGVWSRGVDTVLTGLRGIVREHSASGFPIALLKQYLANRFEWESLDFGDEEMEDLADTGYWDYRVFLLLSLLFPNMDFIKQYHVDHIFPAAAFTSDALRIAGVPDEEHEEYFSMMNGLANLQLLEGSKNTEKQAMFPDKWLNRAYPDASDRASYVETHMLGEVPPGLEGFKDFYAARRERLKERIVQLLGQA